MSRKITSVEGEAEMLKKYQNEKLCCDLIICQWFQIFAIFNFELLSNMFLLALNVL